MKIIIYCLILSLSVISVCSCCFLCTSKDQRPNLDVAILMENNSNVNLICHFQYTDTILQSYNPYTSTLSVRLGTVLSKQERKFPKEKATISKFSPIHLFLIDEDTLLNVDWGRIRSENLILHRYDLTLQDLEDMDWKVEYP